MVLEERIQGIEELEHKFENEQDPDGNGNKENLMIISS